MEREREIIKQMLVLANEYNNISCSNMRCKDGECWSKMNLYNSVTEFVLQANERLGRVSRNISMSKLKEINLKLTKNEYRALSEMITHGYYVCQSGCIYEEMQEKDIECDKCPYTIARYNLENMFEL